MCISCGAWNHFFPAPVVPLAPLRMRGSQKQAEAEQTEHSVPLLEMTLWFSSLLHTRGIGICAFTIFARSSKRTIKSPCNHLIPRRNSTKPQLPNNEAEIHSYVSIQI